MSTQPRLDYFARARSWLGHGSQAFDPATRGVVQLASDRRVVTRDPAALLEATTFGDALADRVAAFGGSWTFIALFVAALAAWIAVNTGLAGAGAVDPFPYIFLNLILSMVAALQAPVIMMSQNRYAAKDRQMAAHDYEINLKAELEIMALHEKMDALRSEQVMQLLAQQQQQIALLTSLVASSSGGGADATGATP